MDQRDLLRKVLSALEAAGVEYILVGSMASAAYGEPRLTLDINVVAALTPGRLPRFLSCFPDPDYYCSREAASEAMKRKGQFNIIHPASGLKIDVIVKKADEFDRSRFTRKRSLAIFPDRPAFVASPEDVIIRKMEYSRKAARRSTCATSPGSSRFPEKNWTFPMSSDGLPGRTCPRSGGRSCRKRKTGNDEPEGTECRS